MLYSTFMLFLLGCRAFTSQLLASKLEKNRLNGSERDVVTIIPARTRRCTKHQQYKYHDTPRQGWKLNCRQLADYTRLSVAHPEHPHGSPCWLMSGQSAHGFCATSIWSSIGHIPRVFLTPWMPAALCAMRPLGSYWCACEGWLRGGWSSLQSVSSTLHFSVCRPWKIHRLRLEEPCRLSARS